VGFVNTLNPLVAGMRVTQGTNVANDASLTNRVLEIGVGKLHPTTDAAFPNTSLDALFTQSGKTYPYFALSHRRGEALHPSSYTAVAGSTGLRFSLKTGDVVRTGGLGSGRPNGLRTGTYLFGLGAGTWARATTLSNNIAQRSVVLVVRPA
jgi:hypothetical protein